MDAQLVASRVVLSSTELVSYYVGIKTLNNLLSYIKKLFIKNPFKNIL
jgi:hypothetical protein